jgi:hypothetical protein
VAEHDDDGDGDDELRGGRHTTYTTKSFTTTSYELDLDY